MTKTSSYNSAEKQQDARRLIILSEGHSEPITAKTAASVLRYKPEDVLALLDTTHVYDFARIDRCAADADCRTQ